MSEYVKDGYQPKGTPGEPVPPHGGSSMQKELNPKFPYNIKRAHRYLMFLYMEHILTGEEFDRAMKRLNKQTGTTWCDLI